MTSQNSCTGETEKECDILTALTWLPSPLSAPHTAGRRPTGMVAELAKGKGHCAHTLGTMRKPEAAANSTAAARECHNTKLIQAWGQDRPSRAAGTQARRQNAPPRGMSNQGLDLAASVPTLGLHLCPISWGHQLLPRAAKTNPCPLPLPLGTIQLSPCGQEGPEAGGGKLTGLHEKKRELGGLWASDPHPSHRPVTTVCSPLWCPGARCQAQCSI